MYETFPEIVNAIIRIYCNGINYEWIKKKYSETHRYYHTIGHIEDMISCMEKNGLRPLAYPNHSITLAVLFHDIFYSPKKGDTTNEVKSAQILLEVCKDSKSSVVKDAVEMILQTAYLDGGPFTNISTQIKYLDLSIFREKVGPKLADSEKRMFKEFQFFDWLIYREERLKALKILRNDPLVNERTVDFLINYNESVIPNIAVYAGSFNQFHVGHLNILQKAEAIFDKVIIARGNRPSKSDIQKHKMPERLDFHQVEEYSGLLTDLIKNFGYPVTLVRGIRSVTDLPEEIAFQRYLSDMMPKIKICLIVCDAQFEHVSSSAIRDLNKFDAGHKYIVK